MLFAAARRHARGARRTPAIAILLLAAACTALEPPPMEPLTERSLGAAERRWQTSGADSYHVVVRLRAPRFSPAVYDLVVTDAHVVRVERDGQPVTSAAADYSVPGLFHLLRDDLRLDAESREGGPPVDLRVRFDEKTGHLVRYRRTVGSARRRVLLIEVLAYEPLERG